MEQIGTGICHASFGELLQGVLPGKSKFLINCRILNVSRVTVRLSSASYISQKEAEFLKSYALYPKTYKGLRIFLSDLGCHDDCLVSIDSNIPVGKGLSSSTADMVAGVRALAEALSLKLKNDYVSRILTDVEPNDGLHFDATSAYHHTEGRLIANVDWVPPFRILGIDQGGVLDTVAFNNRVIAWTNAQMVRYRALLDAALAALNARDGAAIAAIATESARLWQSVNPKADLDQVLDVANRLGALGVINTHSGTYLGLLFTDDANLDAGRAEALTSEAIKGRKLNWYRTTGCGMGSSNLVERKRSYV